MFVLCLLFGSSLFRDSLYSGSTVLQIHVHFSSRLGLPEAWRGLRDEVLSKQSGISGCVFVHANGFIGGNETYEGALEMAERTLAGEEHVNGKDDSSS